MLKQQKNGKFQTQPPLSTDEKIGYELHPIGGGDGGEVCDNDPKPPTPQQIKDWWRVHFEPLLLSSDTHKPQQLAAYTADTEGYIQAIV